MKTLVSSLVTSTSFLVAFAHAEEFEANHMFVSCIGNDSIVEFDEDGDFVRTISPEGLDQPRSIAFGPNGRMYVSSFDTNEVFEILPNGTISRKILLSGMFGPNTVAFGPRGHLFVNCYQFPKIREFEVFESEFIEHDGIGLVTSPLDDIQFTATGTIFGISGNFDQIYEIDTLSHVVRFDDFPDNTIPSGIAIGPKQEVWMGAVGAAGVMHRTADLEPLASFPDAQTFNSPEGMVIGPNGDLFVCILGADRVVRFDPRTKEVVDSIGEGVATLMAPVGIAFAPTRFEARIEGRIAKDGTSLKSFDEDVTLSIAAGSRTITLLFEKGMTGNGLASLLKQNAMTFHGSETIDTGSKRLLDGCEVFTDAASGINTIQLEVKGKESGDLHHFQPSKASGRIAHMGGKMSFFAAIQTKSKID